jgi:hypothetical protein
VRRDGNTLVFEGKDFGDVKDASGTTLAVTYASTVTGSSLTNSGNLDSGSTTGVSVGTVTNPAFVGKIGGFTATYDSTTDQLELAVTVGGHTYKGDVTDTTPGSDTTVRLTSSTGGGYFDIELAKNNGLAVSSQADANAYAQRINAAFESLNFYQNRTVSSFAGNSPIVTDGVVTGTLIGSSFELQSGDFTNVNIDSIRVNAPSGSSPNGSLVITINGEAYTTSANVGKSLGANTAVKLVSA